MSRTYDVAVFDAAGLAGETLLNVLTDSDLALGALYPLAEIVEQDAVVEFKGTELDIISAATFNFADADLLFIPVGSQIGDDILQAAKEAGCLVVNGAEGGEGAIVLPDLNEDLLPEAGECREVAVPASAAVLLLQVLKPLQETAGIDSVNVVVNLSVASAGKAGFEELRSQTIDLLSGKPVNSKVFSQRIAFNMIPEVGELDQQGQTGEERRVTRELVLGLNQDDLRVSATCIRVPTFFGDSLAVHMDMARPVDTATVRDLVSGVKGIDLCQANEIPTVEKAAGNDEILVGRIRQNTDHPDQVSFWVVADTVRYWALQSVTVAEMMLKHFAR